MDFRIVPFGGIWNDGIFNVPSSLVDKYLKMTSEYQLKALLLVLRNGGTATSRQIAKSLGMTVSDIDEFMEYWIEEGILSANGELVEPPPKTEHIVPKEDKQKKDVLPPPRITPKDVVTLCKENDELGVLLSEGQIVLGRTISFAEQELLINMVNYYGLSPEVILMLLSYYRSEKEKGRSISLAYINKMAQNWSEEGINTVTLADEKLLAIAKSDSVWKEIVELAGIRHRNPTVKQREMVSKWADIFNMEMIELACDIMKENTDKPSLKYVDSVLTNWKNSDIKTPGDAARLQEEFKNKKQPKNQTKLVGKPSYDLDQIKKDTMGNTDIKF